MALMGMYRRSSVAAAATVLGGKVSSIRHGDTRSAPAVLAILSVLALAGTSCNEGWAYQSGSKMGSHWYSTGRQSSPMSYRSPPVTSETKYWVPPDSHAARAEPPTYTTSTREPDPRATHAVSPVARRVYATAPSPVELLDLVRRLGGASDPDPIASNSFWRLLAAPRPAARELVGALKVISPDQLDDDARHVIWCVRTLRAITGQDFRFKSTTPLTANQCRDFRTCFGPMPFFSDLMGGREVIVAPADVQKKVIVAWQLWLLERGDTFIPDDRLDPLNWSY
jgi:hypothetical protein